MFDIVRKNVKLVEKLVIDNSPTILTAVGVVGIVATGVFSYKAAYKQGVKDSTAGVPEDKLKYVKENWSGHVLPAGVGALSICAVVGANRISTSRALALGAAYALSTEKYSDYKDKIEEKFSKKKLDEVQTEIAQEGVDKNPPSNQVIFLGSGEVLFKDSWSGRYFMSDMESIRKAVNDANFEIRNGSYCSLTSFYHMIGLSATFDSDEIGWNDDSPLDVTFSTVLHEGKPVIVFDFDVIPIRGYYQGHS